jgi:cytoskeletal protein CcmA (bactofilin family)
MNIWASTAAEFAAMLGHRRLVELEWESAEELMTSKNPQQESHPRRRFTDGRDTCETVIGADVTIRGDVRGCSNMEMRGTLEGDIEMEGFLWLRAGGRVVGNLIATDVVIEGEVTGDVVAQNKLELRASCRVTGDLSSNTLAIAEGGFFEGKITTAGVTRNREAVSYQEKRSDE